MVPTLGQANRWINPQPSYTRPAELLQYYCFRVTFGTFPTICFASCDFCEVLIEPSALNSAGATAVISYENILGSTEEHIVGSCGWSPCQCRWCIDNWRQDPRTINEEKIRRCQHEKEGPGPDMFYHEEANQSRWRRCAHVTFAAVSPATQHCQFQWSTWPNITQKQYYDNSAGRVYDGCGLIHRLDWPKVGTMGSICETCVGYPHASAAPEVQVCVVFDCYDGKQRRLQSKNGGALRRDHIQM